MPGVICAFIISWYSGVPWCIREKIPAGGLYGVKTMKEGASGVCTTSLILKFVG